MMTYIWYGCIECVWKLIHCVLQMHQLSGCALWIKYTLPKGNLCVHECSVTPYSLDYKWEEHDFTNKLTDIIVSLSQWLVLRLELICSLVVIMDCPSWYYCEYWTYYCQSCFRYWIYWINRRRIHSSLWLPTIIFGMIINTLLWTFLINFLLSLMKDDVLYTYQCLLRIIDYSCNKIRSVLETWFLFH